MVRPTAESGKNVTTAADVSASAKAFFHEAAYQPCICCRRAGLKSRVAVFDHELPLDQSFIGGANIRRDWQNG